MELAAVPVPHQALERVGSGGLPSAAIPVVAGREIDRAVVALRASLSPLLEHVVLVAAGVELVAGRRHEANRDGAALLPAGRLDLGGGVGGHGQAIDAQDLSEVGHDR